MIALTVGSAVLVATLIVPAGAAPLATRTYTLDADFDEGTADNVVHTPSNQLQLDTIPTSPFIWIALSARGTIAKIDTSDGTILGEYSTTSDGDNRSDPSRTTVTNDGSVWAGNRLQSSAIHVGVSEAGGCVDRNGNGTIQTSTGYGVVLSWPGGTDGASSSVSAATDECILHYVDTVGGDARHVSVRADGNVWIGNHNGFPHTFQLRNNSTGALMQTADIACGGYGGLVDGNGVLWSAGAFSAKLLRWDPNAATLGDGEAPGSNPRCISVSSYGGSAYGIAFDSNNFIWVTMFLGGQVLKVSPDGTAIQSFSMGPGHTKAQGLAVDDNDHVWISSSNQGGNNSIAHLLNDGTHIGQVTGAGIDSTGVAVDAAGKIWTTNMTSSDATRIDPSAGALGADATTPIGAFDLTVPLPGAAPYNYSDMTGSTLTGKPQTGTWSVVYDSGIEGAEWGTASWTADTPGGSQLTVTVESSADGTSFGSPETASNGGELSVADGRYLRATTTFTKGTNEQSPTLYDLTLSTIEEDDPSELTIDDVTQIEGDSGTSSFTFTVSKTGAQAGTVDYTVAQQISDTADSSSDFDAASGTLTFAGDDLSKTIDVVVQGDVADEGDETFTVALSNPVGLQITGGTGLGTIDNDDAATITVSSPTVTEGDSGTVTLDYVFTADQTPVGDASLDYATDDGTAIQPGDYDSKTGTVTFADATTDLTRTVSVTVNPDTLAEADETVLLDLDNPVGSRPGTTQATGTIEDDDDDEVSGGGGGFNPVDVVPEVSLTVSRTGGGGGGVTSTPSGINCGSDCTQSYVSGTSVTLTATADPGSSFSGWSGDCSGTSTCTLTMSSDRAATATFEPTFDLTVTTAGTGSGTAMNSPGGIDCGPACSGAYRDGTSVTLTASADADSAFDNWGGCDSTSGKQCTVMMSEDRTVIMSFDVAPVSKNKCRDQVVTIQVSAADETTLGTAGDDVLMGTSGIDTIYGLGGDDVICGRAGNDLLYGGPGADTINGGSGRDHLYGGVGLGGGPWGDKLYGGAGQDRLFGDGGDDHLAGGLGDDWLYGNPGNDSLYGNAGNDRLFGGLDADACNGGAGPEDTATFCEPFIQ